MGRVQQFSGWDQLWETREPGETAVRCRLHINTEGKKENINKEVPRKIKKSHTRRAAPRHLNTFQRRGGSKRKETHHFPGMTKGNPSRGLNFILSHRSKKKPSGVTRVKRCDYTITRPKISESKIVWERAHRRKELVQIGHGTSGSEKKQKMACFMIKSRTM